MKWILGAYLVMSVVTFAAYGLDKRAAKKGRRRTPERRLHAFELLGGWPGAFLGQRVFRHKTQSPGFLLVFWLIVVVHALAWGVYVWFRFA